MIRWTKALSLGGMISGLALVVALPFLHAAVLGANFVVQMFLLVQQCLGVRLPRVQPSVRTGPRRQPFVSIHVPAHNEPPELLMETLASMARLDWEHYEVLVVDNNTRDPALWKPVEAFCGRLGPRFRFFHVEGLTGFKAGALNWVRSFTDPRAEFLFVVDADYVLRPDCLHRALRYDTDPRIGLIQFPQHYRNSVAANAGIALDYQHFFSGYMNMANRFGCVPSTGTLSLLRLSALKAVGGFDTRVITEDAELGFRLNVQGYRTLYVPEIVGSGLMPHDLQDLKKQRWRWAFGNAQILKSRLGTLLFGRELGWIQKIGFLTHLSSWFNFNLIPSLSLIVFALLAAADRLTVLQHYLAILSGLSIALFYILRFATLFYSLRPEGIPLGQIGRAFLAHVGLGWTLSASWLKCLWNDRSPFLRTNKFLADRMPGLLQAAFLELALAAGLLASCVVLTLSGFILAPVAALLVGAGRLAILVLWKEMQHTCRATRRLLPDLSHGGGEIPEGKPLMILAGAPRPPRRAA